MQTSSPADLPDGAIVGSVPPEEERPIPFTELIFAPRKEEMNKGFLMFSQDEGLTMLKDEPEDLTHLAPTAGDACIPLENSPFELFDELLNNNYCCLLNDDLGNASPVHSLPGESLLMSSPEPHESDSSCGQSSLLTDLSLDPFDGPRSDNDIDDGNSPFIPNDDLPVLEPAVMWGALPDNVSLAKPQPSEIQNTSSAPALQRLLAAPPTGPPPQDLITNIYSDSGLMPSRSIASWETGVKRTIPKQEDEPIAKRIKRSPSPVSTSTTSSASSPSSSVLMNLLDTEKLLRQQAHHEPPPDYAAHPQKLMAQNSDSNNVIVNNNNLIVNNSDFRRRSPLVNNNNNVSIEKCNIRSANQIPANNSRNINLNNNIFNLNNSGIRNNRSNNDINNVNSKIQSNNSMLNNNFKFVNNTLIDNGTSDNKFKIITGSVPMNSSNFRMINSNIPLSYSPINNSKIPINNGNIFINNNNNIPIPVINIIQSIPTQIRNQVLRPNTPNYDSSRTNSPISMSPLNISIGSPMYSLSSSPSYSPIMSPSQRDNVSPYATPQSMSPIGNYGQMYYSGSRLTSSVQGKCCDPYLSNKMQPSPNYILQPIDQLMDTSMPLSPEFWNNPDMMQGTSELLTALDDVKLD